MKEYRNKDAVARELEMCGERLAHTEARMRELEEKGERIHESLRPLLKDYMERLELDVEKWRDEIARLECEMQGREE